MFKILIITVEIRIMYSSFAFFSSKHQNSGSFTLNRCLQVRMFSVVPTRAVRKLYSTDFSNRNLS